jgi:hypothetical protein
MKFWWENLPENVHFEYREVWRITTGFIFRKHGSGCPMTSFDISDAEQPDVPAKPEVKFPFTVMHY